METFIPVACIVFICVFAAVAYLVGELVDMNERIESQQSDMKKIIELYNLDKEFR